MARLRRRSPPPGCLPWRYTCSPRSGRRCSWPGSPSACAAFEERDLQVIRALCRVAFVAPLLALGLGAFSSVAGIGPVVPLCAHAASSNRVGLVVEHGDGQMIRRCIGFDGSTTSAVAVLQASGLEIGLDTYGC